MEIHDIFPTKVLVNENPKLDINKQEMMKDIDDIILDGKHMCAPSYQCQKILFQHWQKHWSVNWENLMNSFKSHVDTYLSMARESYGPPELYTIAYTEAWFYRKDMENRNNTYDNNPVHNHFPSQVVGVYYLDNPGCDGTTLYNPCNLMHNHSSEQSMAVCSGGWVIFPGWIQHNTSYSAIAGGLGRTVISCNAYLKVVN
jgi:hypothetical protein